MPIKSSLVARLMCAIALLTNGHAGAMDRTSHLGQVPHKKHPGRDPRQIGHELLGSTLSGKSKDEPAATKLASLQTSPSRAYYRSLIEKEAAGTGLSPDLAESVMEVESGYNPGAVGSSGEIGLMQVMPSTARMMGFVQPMSALADPENNIHYGVTYLAKAWRLAGGDLCTAVMKYRAGHGETRFSSLSVDYCLAVRSKLQARGIPVAGAVPVASFVSRGAALSRLESGRCRRGCIGGVGGARVDFASLNARLTAIVGQVRPVKE